MMIHVKFSLLKIALVNTVLRILIFPLEGKDLQPPDLQVRFYTGIGNLIGGRNLNRILLLVPWNLRMVFFLALGVEEDRILLLWVNGSLKMASK